MTKRGFVYACSHPKWLPETLRSASSVRERMPDVAREFFGPADLVAHHRAALDHAFTDIFVIDDAGFPHRPRFAALRSTRLDRAVFIDGDTFIARACYELFDVLDDYDAGLVLAPQLHHYKSISSGLLEILPKISMAVPEPNAGMIVAKINDRFQAFVKLWSEYFITSLKHGYQMDQASLRIALAKSKLHVANLPNNYNFRANLPQAICGDVSIIHCHGELERIAEILNQRKGIRHYTPDARLVHGYMPKEAQ